VLFQRVIGLVAIWLSGTMVAMRRLGSVVWIPVYLRESRFPAGRSERLIRTLPKEGRERQLADRDQAEAEKPGILSSGREAGEKTRCFASSDRLMMVREG
jgi:hypothetical protein